MLQTKTIGKALYLLLIPETLRLGPCSDWYTQDVGTALMIIIMS